MGAGTPTPIPDERLIPKLGPCQGQPAPQPQPVGSPFMFQQNPCTFPSWESNITQTTYQVEVNEAAADMFLNWVYDAFDDMRWRGSGCYPNGCDDPYGSGQVRDNWMDTQIEELLVQFGWQ